MDSAAVRSSVSHQWILELGQWRSRVVSMMGARRRSERLFLHATFSYPNHESMEPPPLGSVV